MNFLLEHYDVVLGILGVAGVALVVLKVIAKFTPTKVDDTIVEVVDEVVKAAKDELKKQKADKE